MTEPRRKLLRESAREMAVVVLSILIAFGLDAWWDSNLDRREERELVGRLLEEFRANEAQLDTRIENHRRLANGADELVRVLSLATVEVINVPDTLLFSLFIVPTFDPTLGTLEEARHSGRTRLIRDPGLRSELGAWPGRLRDVREEEQLALELVQDQFFAVIGDRVSLWDLMELGGAWLAGAPAGRLESTRPVPPGTALRNYAKMRWVWNRRAAEELASLREDVRRIIALLEAKTGS